MDDKLPEPTQDAFNKGFLNFDYVKKAVKKINRPLEFVCSTLNKAEVKESKEKMTVDLTKMVESSTGVYLIVNGELAYAKVMMILSPDPNP
jgi:hypothetical protein